MSIVSFQKEERRILIDLQKVLMNVVHDKRMKIIKHSSPILSHLVFLINVEKNQFYLKLVKFLYLG